MAMRAEDDRLRLGFRRIRRRAVPDVPQMEWQTLRDLRRDESRGADREARDASGRLGPFRLRRRRPLRGEKRGGAEEKPGAGRGPPAFSPPGPPPPKKKKNTPPPRRSAPRDKIKRHRRGRAASQLQRWLLRESARSGRFRIERS